MAEALKVAVRVRPFNGRETSRKAKLIIDMNGNSTSIKDPENPKAEPKRFAFDFSYWSHDGYKEKGDGYLEPTGSKYADQQKVFDDLGRGVLSNAWKGYNVSLFAYGQTGSGKSYSMVGYGNNKGIVPISCEKLFEEIELKRKDCKKGEEFQVTYSMMEIYNEQVRDLLSPASLKVKGGLKVRQNPKVGFYVEQLKAIPVHSYKEIEKKTDEGTKNRTVASTNMNATSSRAHTIVAIHFTQKTMNDAGKSMTKSSIINLVDLAGSERAESTGATGDRLKEGANINRSLSTLGNVIKALADQCMGKKGVMVPYRDSTLTKLLMNALGGNSKTIMIAALSPADINYEETLSTLRFADRAKSVKTSATVNESPTDKLIRELREENDKLKKMLQSGGVPAGVAAGGGGDGGDAEEMAERLKANEEEMEALKKSFEEEYEKRKKELMAELEADKKEKEKEKTIPHIVNLNEDPALSGKIVHLLNGKVKIGSNKADKTPDIPLSGLGIQPDHAMIQNDKNKKVTLMPTKGAHILLNGNVITSKKELAHNDRICFGNTNLFVLVHPIQQADLVKKNKDVKQPTYEDANEEIAKNSGLSKLAGNGKSKEDLLLLEDLLQIWPMVGEANAMSDEMDKQVGFEIALVSPQARGHKHGRTQVCVKMKNLSTKHEFMWDRETFINRKFLMQEMYQNFCDGENVASIPKEQDPFWEDPSTPVLIGCVHVYLKSLGYLIELEEQLQITDYKGEGQGQLSVAITPCNKDGKELGDDDFVEEPSELIGKSMHCRVNVIKALGISKRFKESFCSYKLYLNDKPTTTNTTPGMNPQYKHDEKFSFNPVTKQFVEYLENDPLVVEIWGRQEAAGKNLGAHLSTQELRMRDKSKPAKPGQNDVKYKMAAETSMYKNRMARSEAKLNKLKELIQDAKKKNKSSITVEEFERAMNSGSRLKAVANVIIQTEKARKATELGQTASAACVLQ